MLPLALLALAGPPELPAPPDPAYSKALERAIERAERRVEASLVLWEDHTDPANPWRVVSDHYEVVTNHSWAFGKEVSVYLEEMLVQFQSVLGTDFAPAEPFRILVLADLAAYNAFGDQYGAEHSSFLGSFYAAGHPDQVVATYHNTNGPLSRMWITHSAFHQFRAAAFPQASPPAWLEEGLACYFGSFGDYAYVRSELLRIRSSSHPDAWIPLSKLITDGVASYGDRFHNRMVELAMLFTYLRIFREGTRTVVDGEVLLEAPFEEYLALWIRGEDPSGHPLHELFTERLDELEQEFKTYAF